MKLSRYRGASVPHEGGPRRTAVCLCGGGITGALFEVGVLAALDDVLSCPASTQFDVYVGASAGASVASVIAQGQTADRMFRALEDSSDPFFPLRRTDVYRVEPAAWARAAARFARGVAATLIEHARSHGDSLGDDLATLHELLPAGLFTLDGYARFLRAFYEREHMATRFSGVRKDLYVVASDVDSAERVVFGDGALRGADIASAVAASSAIPIFFEPVAIDGRDYIDGGVGRVAHLDVAIDHGAERVLIVNPVVPLHNELGRSRLPSRRGEHTRLRDTGLLRVGSQAWRIANKLRLQFGIKRYLAEHPRVEVTLVEPSVEDTLLFVNGSMGLRVRTEILEYARKGARAAFERALCSEPTLFGDGESAPWSKRAPS